MRAGLFLCAEFGPALALRAFAITFCTREEGGEKSYTKVIQNLYTFTLFWIEKKGKGKRIRRAPRACQKMRLKLFLFYRLSGLVYNYSVANSQ